jgi:ferredoxin
MPPGWGDRAGLEGAMTEKRIPYTDLVRLLARLRERGAVYAPARDEAGDVVLTGLLCDEPVVLEYRNFRLSPKAFLLPQNQMLICFKDGKAEEPALPDRETFLFGVRPCDARAMLALDKIFLDGNQRDPYYAHLRARTAVIALACTRPMPSCFCTSVGGGPGDAAGADVLAVTLEADLLLKAQTPRGEALLSSVADLLAEATPAAVKKAEEQVRAAEEQMAPVRAEDSARRLRDAYDSPLWEVAGQKCLGCGTCSFLCPTCHCFDITDEVRGGTGRRVRTWDCCAYPLFTLQASGHNPRPMPRERWRQRIMHKFRYAVENFDCLFCVGCGRCIRNCPVSMDLRTVLKEVGA